MNPAAFDSIAVEYDRSFTETKLGRQLRALVWERMKENISMGDYVLELNCGTAEDAIWLAQQGCRVLATDISTDMLEVASHKVRHFNLADKIDLKQLDLTAPVLDIKNKKFDSVLSNFGGLNCAQNLHPIASYLAENVASGGRVVLVVMGRWCLWEIIWHLLHLEGKTAFRRFHRAGVDVKLGNAGLHVWYPSVKDIQGHFQKFFIIKRITGLGVFLPPSYLENFLLTHQLLWRFLTRLENMLAASFPFKYFADHLIYEYEHI